MRKASLHAVALYTFIVDLPFTTTTSKSEGWKMDLPDVFEPEAVQADIYLSIFDVSVDALCTSDSQLS